jgi:multidrug efflux pump subunit AcrA (membrane-fusion protein)
MTGCLAVRRGARLTAVTIMACALAGCSRPEPPPTAHSHPEEPPAPTNRVAIPEAVRRNLGMTFARVEARHVGRTLRMPGRFEIPPEARREYHAPLPGIVELRVRQYDRVETGTLLYRLDSTEWRRIKQEYAQTLAEARTASVTLESAQVWHRHLHKDNAATGIPAGSQRIEGLRAAAEAAAERVRQLERASAAVGAQTPEIAEARNRLGEAQADLAQAIVDFATLEANYHAAEVALESATTKARLLLNTMASHTGLTPDQLEEPAPDGVTPRWQTLNQIEFRAAGEGVVDRIALTSGAYAEAAALVLSTVSPEQVRFRAVALQSDTSRLRDGMKALIVPPAGHDDEPLTGTLHIGLEADPDERTRDVVVTPHAPARWARAGVTAHAEAVLDETLEPQLAVPRAAVIQDGLAMVIFRRNPDNPDEAIRLEADLGLDDGRWVVVESGLREGDEVVLDGIYELKLSGSGKGTPAGGHFHADGTFHAGDEH